MFTYQFLFCFFVLGGLHATKASEHRYDVIVIGAGAGGLSAARELHDSGNDNFIVLEAKDRLGGRIHTVDFDGALVEYGPSYIFGEKGNAVYKMAKEAGQLAHHDRYVMPAIYDSTGRDMDLSTIASLSQFEMRLAKSEELKNATGSYWDFVWPRLKQELIMRGRTDRTMEYWYSAFEKILALQHFSDSIQDLGARGASEFILPDGYLEHMWKRGYGTLINILLGKKNGTKSAIEPKIHTNKEVVKAEYSDEGYKVECADGSVYHGNKVISAMPLGVLKSLPENFWSPPLTDGQKKGIENLGLSGLNKIILKFEKRWWPGDTKAFHQAYNKSMIEQFKSETNFGTWPLSILAANTVPRHPKYLEIWITGDGSREMENRSDEEVIEASMDYFKRMFPRKKNISGPKMMIRSKWNSDRFIKGSQTYRSVKTDAANIKFDDIIRPLMHNGKPILAFAGEFAHPHYFGTVHGAVASGRKAVKLLNH